MTKATYNYTMPANDLIVEVKSGADLASNITFFLMENGKGIWDTWSGKMRAADQRKLFGGSMGKGSIWVDGLDESVQHVIKVCFGTDIQTTGILYCNGRRSFVETDGAYQDAWIN